LSQVLEFIFRKDKGFAEWLVSNGGVKTPEVADIQPEETIQPGGDPHPERAPNRELNRVRIGGTQ
jgi:hypothetical protein